MLLLRSWRFQQHRPRLMEARNFPLVSANCSWRVWYSIAFFQREGSRWARIWQFTPMQLQARASPCESPMLLQTWRNFQQYCTAFFGLFMLSRITPIEQQALPQSLIFPPLRHPNASISQSFNLLMADMYTSFSTFSVEVSSLSLLFKKLWGLRHGVLKNRGSQIRWGREGATTSEFLGLLKFLTSFSSASVPTLVWVKERSTLQDLLRLQAFLLIGCYNKYIQRVVRWGFIQPLSKQRERGDITNTLKQSESSFSSPKQSSHRVIGLS